MIRCTLHSRDGVLTGFECSGHAGYADPGLDIVCAAVSVLTTTCANALETVAGIKPLVRCSPGRMLVAVPQGSGHDAQVILLSFRQGMRDLAQQYSRYLLLIEN